MKKRITKKAIEARYNTIICVPYCELQFLLHYLQPVSYTTGIYGWNADIYDINGIAIVTGYRPFGNIKPDYNTLREYDKTAKSIVYNYNSTIDNYEAHKAALDKLINEFINKVTA